MLTVLPMNNKLFLQRKRVINMLYAARSVIGREMPRIKVRIVEFKKDSTLGLCFIDKDYITISSDCVNWSDQLLRHVVWHELCHAWFNTQHDENCPLMRSKVSTGCTLDQAVAALKQYSYQPKGK